MTWHLDKKTKGKTTKVKTYEVEFDHVYHLKNFYKGLYQVMVDNSYSSPNGGEPEDLYFEIINAEGMVNHYIWWRFIKRYHNYFDVFISIDWRGIMTAKHEVVHNGQKRKTNKGDMTLNVDAYVIWDPDDKIRKHWFLKHFEGFMKRKIYNKVALWIEDEAKGDAETIRSYMKRYWQLKADEPAQKLFLHENKGLGDKTVPQQQ